MERYHCSTLLLLDCFTRSKTGLPTRVLPLMAGRARWGARRADRLRAATEVCVAGRCRLLSLCSRSATHCSMPALKPRLMLASTLPKTPTRRVVRQRERGRE